MSTRLVTVRPEVPVTASEDHRQLQQEAVARKVSREHAVRFDDERVEELGATILEMVTYERAASMTACVGDCLREYFALRTEMASAVTAPGKPGERHTGLIHSILARTEQRLVATLDARTTWTSANRRYANFRKFVDEQLSKDSLDGEGDDDGPGGTER